MKLEQAEWAHLTSTSTQMHLLNGSHQRWGVGPESLSKVFPGSFKVISTSSTSIISTQIGDRLNQRLLRLPSYLGAFEVDESSNTHRALYFESLVAQCRFTDRAVKIFCEGFEGEDLDQSLLELCWQTGFTDVQYEVFSQAVFIDWETSPCLILI